MLIEFRTANFRSIREAQSLSMVASIHKERRKSNTFAPRLPGVERLLRSAAIYGANAAGKTNVLRAIQFMQAFVVQLSSALAQGQLIPHMPYMFSSTTRSAPSEFEVTISQHGVRYQYSFAADSERVHYEALLAFPSGRKQQLFTRTYNKKLKRYDWTFSTKLKGNRSVWRDATRPNALFLSTAVQLNSEQLRPVFDWFKLRLVVIAGITSFNRGLTLRLLEQPKSKERILPLIRMADLGIADMKVTREQLVPGSSIVGGAYIEQLEANTPASVVRVASYHRADDSNELVPLGLEEESSGTQAFLWSAGAWNNVLSNAEVLLFDEIDTSLHPLLVRLLVEQFHSEETNPRNAQLLFTTHDPSLLDADLLRRDQVWFVEKRDAGASVIYPLSDFSPRKEEKLQKGYLQGRYGALPIIGTR